MISKGEYAVVRRFAKLACRFGMLPGDWNNEEEKVVLPKSKRKKFANIFLLGLHSCYSAFNLFWLSFEIGAGSKLNRLLIHLVYTCINICSVIYHIHILKYQGEVIDLFNLLGNFTNTTGKVIQGLRVKSGLSFIDTERL